MTVTQERPLLVFADGRVMTIPLCPAAFYILETKSLADPPAPDKRHLFAGRYATCDAGPACVWTSVFIEVPEDP